MTDPGLDPAVDPILCSPYAEPDEHWELDQAGRARAGVSPEPGRRPSAMIRPVPDDHKHAQYALDMDTALVNEAVMAIRERVGEWRRGGYPHTTSVTRRLLRHWADDDAHRRHRPFFAQREAIETLIWLREAADRATRERRLVEEDSRRLNDGIVRYCAKMATGTGKTAVMGMLIAWQTLNAVRSRRRRNLQHSSRFLVLTPGLTVRDRLAVLDPAGTDNVYDELGLLPPDLRGDIKAARVETVNFQRFRRRDPSEATGAQKAILGARRADQTETPEAMMRRVLGHLLRARGAHGDLVVINDEAHHCYLPDAAAPAAAGSAAARKTARSAEEKDADKIAAVWFNAIRTLRDMGALGGLDRHGGQASPVYDFSATPMWIARAGRGESPMFEWVTSDFGLMDAIESGLVKVPRVPVDDDTGASSTAWRRLYDKTARKRLPKRSDNPAAALPEPLDGALRATVNEWRRTYERTRTAGRPTPPVMIVVANTVDNAVALYEHIAGCETAEGQLLEGRVEEFSNVVGGGEGATPRWRDEPRTLLVHSRLDDDEAVNARFRKLLRDQARHMGDEAPADAVREALNTVGKPGRLGAGVCCVVSVSMLTEGWDARTVTQILGFRAFSSQLLCEQVTGRALRRTSYDAFREEPGKELLLTPEYAEVLGIPFEFMPARRAGPSPDPLPRTEVHSVRGRARRRISWPQATEYLTVAPASGFRLDPSKVKPALLTEDAEAEIVEVAGVSGETLLLNAEEGKREKAAMVRCAAEIANLLTDGTQSAFGSLAAGPAVADGGAGDRDEDAGGRQASSASSDDPATGTGDAPDPAGGPGDAGGADAGTGEPLSSSGRSAMFVSAYRALRDWLAHPDVDCERASVLLRHRDRRDHYGDLIAACRFASTPPPRRIAALGSPPLADSRDVRFETTLRHVLACKHSELSHAACHSRLELRCARILDQHPAVEAWARNFGLGWSLPYHFDGAWRLYEPDFVARLAGGLNVVIECKGVADDKARAAEAWTREHWIPAMAGTPQLPDDLRRWAYEVIFDSDHLPGRLDDLAKVSP